MIVFTYNSEKKFWEKKYSSFPAKTLEAFIAYRLVLDLNLIMLNLMISIKRVLFTYLNTNC